MRPAARPPERTDDSTTRRTPPARSSPARPSAVRAVAAGAAVVTVAAGLAVRAGADGAFAKYAGSALYTVLLCTLVAFCAPRARPAVVGATALGLSWAVEFAQLTGVPAELSAHSAAARLVLGSTFNAPDLLWYAVGAACAWAILRAAGQRR
ncbi:DUF2809 domain-containing protein [Streptomyces sp. CA-278952]|uniref:ribosomal maturation YjgA family protein n=1 Tax=Streptomyces sp. CA-278952 TaxID=2980556 RepID=UPI002367CEDB|nr:DUF2809 domain-containing protein [Streptomyces sp. CA-278952]WDG29463.1 DUF2809 domain-containing protein [Streptomyces sp. CA-278952]